MGVGAFFAIRIGVLRLMPNQSGPIAQGFNQGISAALETIVWIVFAMCCLAAKGWRQFELLAGQVFHRLGYAVEETGLCGADGGINLILLKDGRRAPVQCKQKRGRQVSVSVMREMYVLLAFPNVDAGKIVRSYIHAKETELFAQEQPIARERFAAAGKNLGGHAGLQHAARLAGTKSEPARNVRTVEAPQECRYPISRFDLRNKGVENE
ncbi:restriction endonuclease [Xanthomonas arboricola]|uniref:restriction endonuclease n=1 Tax=Xanthomonas arboricola TaxID=56448 RepID=UPI0015E2D350|nr:restriction endonuclease [Xanthomonas arboricola]